jgi:hypothetical protein
VIFKGVPAELWTNCGEYYLSDRVTEELLQRAEQAIASGAEVESVAMLREEHYPDLLAAISLSGEYLLPVVALFSRSVRTRLLEADRIASGRFQGQSASIS